MATLLAAAVVLEADVHHLAAASDANVIIIVVAAQFIQHSRIHRDIYEIPSAISPSLI